MRKKATIEKEILLRARDGDQEAFEHIVYTYERPIFSFIYRLIGGHRDDAAELTQEAFLKLYQSMGNYNPEKEFSAWLFTIARNTVYDRLRKKQRQKEYYDIDDPENPKDLPDNRESVRSMSRRVEEKLDIEEALSHVKTNYREILLLYYWQEYTYEEIATILGIPVNTVKTHIRRAKLAVLKELVKENV